MLPKFTKVSNWTSLCLIIRCLFIDGLQKMTIKQIAEPNIVSPFIRNSKRYLSAPTFPNCKDNLESQR